MNTLVKKINQRARAVPLPLVVLSVIVLLAAVLRFYQLATLPATLNRDEAALAYNALLLKETGQDEWGRSWPIALESFGDYKLPGYPLLLIPSYQLFGVNDFAVRLPSALAGTGLVVLGYLFARKVLNLQEFSSLFVAFSIAVQPVFFFYSRMAWEANVGLFFLLISVVLLLAQRSKRHATKLDLVALVFAALAIATYNTPLLLLPFVTVAVILSRGVTRIKTWRLPVIGLGLLFIAGFAAFASISQQKSGITLFSDETTWQRSVEYYESFSGWQRTIFGNRYVFLAGEVTKNFLNSFTPTFLVTQGGGHPWHSIPGTGHLLIATYCLALLGILRLVFLLIHPKTPRRRDYLIVLFLLVTSLAPAVITVDAPHATRSLLFFFMMTVISGTGLEWIYSQINQPSQYQSTLKFIFILTLILGLTNELNKYYFAYFHNYPKQSSTILKAGLAQAVQKIEARDHGQTEQIAIVDPDGFHYISVAWALKMPPDRFFSTINHHLPDRIGLKYGYRVGRYRFIADRDDRMEEDIHLIEWDPRTDRWIIDMNL